MYKTGQGQFRRTGTTAGNLIGLKNTDGNSSLSQLNGCGKTIWSSTNNNCII
jgi:hypothetical protein